MFTVSFFYVPSFDSTLSFLSSSFSICGPAQLNKNAGLVYVVDTAVTNSSVVINGYQRKFGQAYSIVIWSLPQDESLEEPLQYKVDWKERFDEFVKQHLAENQWNDPLSVQEILNTFL